MGYEIAFVPIKGLEYLGVVMVFQKFHLKNAANTHLHIFSIDVFKMVASILVVLQIDSPSLNVLIHDIAFL